MDWHPRLVDELSLDEEFWLPLVKQARSDAISTLNAITEMQQNQPLQH
jgi:predicted DNA-binding ribbon-helix-helix protein